MSAPREWQTVTKAKPCPACGKPDWCAWSGEGYLKCERSSTPPPGMVAVSVRDGGAVFGPERPERNGHGPPKKKAPAALAREGGKTRKQVYATDAQALCELDRVVGCACVKWWAYHGANGEAVGLVARYETPQGKTYRPIARTDAGWVIGAMSKPRPLFKLPALLAAGPETIIMVCEGEKAADAAAACGWVSTTSAGGCKAAKQTDWSSMRGRDVVIIPDNDEPGEAYAADVVRLATAAGARSVRVVRLSERWSDLPPGGDLADVLELAGGDVEAVRAAVAELIEAASPETIEADERPTWKPFPTHTLPEPVRGFVIEGAAAIGCDESYIALPLLSALAAAIGNTRRIALNRVWPEGPNLWTAIVGESGTMKTPAFKLAMSAIRKAQARAFKEHDAALAEWEAQHLRYEAELTGWKREAAKGHGDAGDPPEEPIAPIARRYVVSDTTIEALAPILRGNPRGVLLARDELAGWLGSFDRYAKAGKAGADSAHWLSMHNGEAMTVDRRTGIPPTIHVPSASVSITGGIQPGILARALGQEHHENGMAARLLFATPPRKVKRWTEAELSEKAEAAVALVFDRLFELTPEADDDGDDRPRLVRLSVEGKRAWVRFYNEHATEQVELSGDLAAAWSKLEGYAARLALVIHLVRVAAGDTTLRDPERVDEVSIAAGVALSRWFGNEARRVYAILSETEEDRKTRQLVEWIKRKGGSVTPRDVTKGMRAYRNDPEAAERALSALVAAGRGNWENETHGPKGGRPARRFRLVTTVTVTETPKNAEENLGYGDGDTGDTLSDIDGWREVGP